MGKSRFVKPFGLFGGFSPLSSSSNSDNDTEDDSNPDKINNNGIPWRKEINLPYITSEAKNIHKYHPYSLSITTPTHIQNRELAQSGIYEVNIDPKGYKTKMYNKVTGEQKEVIRYMKYRRSIAYPDRYREKKYYQFKNIASVINMDQKMCYVVDSKAKIHCVNWGSLTSATIPTATIKTNRFRMVLN